MSHRAEGQLTATGWGRLHRLALIGLVTSSLATAFLDGTERGLGFALFFTALSVCGLILSRLFEPTISDFLRAMSPRDSVLFFLVHGVVMAVPGFLGYWEWTVALSALIGFVSYVSVDKMGYGRLHAACMLLVFLACASEPLPRLEPLAACVLFLLLCYRLDHLAMRLSLHGDGRGLPILPALKQTVLWVLLPWAGATTLFAWLTPLMAPSTRFLTFEPGERTAAAVMAQNTSLETLVRDTVLLLLIAAGLVFVAWWFERRLGFRRKGSDARSEDKLAATSSVVRGSKRQSPVPQPEILRDARGVVLARFKVLSETFGKIGFSRGKSETAREYVQRIWRELQIKEPPPTQQLSPFQNACYSSLSVSNEEAKVFLAWANGAEAEVRVAAEKQRAGEAMKDAMP